MISNYSEPWTVAMSASRGMKYFYNLQSRESKFEIPRESIADVRYMVYILKMEQAEEMQCKIYVPNVDRN